MTIVRRLRLLRHRTTRWFQPPVRGASEPQSGDDERESPSRSSKPPISLH